MKEFTREHLVDTLVARDMAMEARDLAYLLKNGTVGYANMSDVGLCEDFVSCEGITESFVLVLNSPYKRKVLVEVFEGGEVGFKSL